MRFRVVFHLMIEEKRFMSRRNLGGSRYKPVRRQLAQGSAYAKPAVPAFCPYKKRRRDFGMAGREAGFALIGLSTSRLACRKCSLLS